MILKNIIFLFSFLFLLNAKATELYEPGPSARSLAMGGTYMSFVKGADSLYYNAAALARVEGFDFKIAQINAAYSKDAARLVDQITKKGGSTSFSAADVNGFYGLNSFADVTARSGFVMPFIGFGVYSSNYVLESFNNPPFPTFNANFISDYGYVIGGAIPVAPMTSIGIAARHVNRWGGTKDILVTDLIGSNDQTVLENAFQDKGTGNALDLSFITTLPTVPLSPTISGLWQDVGRTTFTQTAGSSAPPSQADNMTLGISIQQELYLVDWTAAAEYHFIGTPNESISKKVHLGTEASFGLFDVRVGLNQGYLTYGGGVDLWFFTADVAYYTSELGTSAGQLRNDRVVYSLSIDLDLDQSFKLKDGSGKNRRLKQRR